MLAPHCAAAATHPRLRVYPQCRPLSIRHGARGSSRAARDIPYPKTLFLHEKRAGFPTLEKSSGGDLLSHTVSRAVPSALEGLTSVFGMGTGDHLRYGHREHFIRFSKLSGNVPSKLHSDLQGSRPSPRPISTGQLHALPRFHIRPINLVIYEGSYPVSRWEN